MIDLIWNNFYAFLPRNLIEIMKTENECHALSEFFRIFGQSLHTSCLLHSFERLILVHRSLLTGFEERGQGFYTSNHFNALYGPVNGLYGFIEKWSKECQERKSSFRNKKRRIKIRMLKWGWHFYSIGI